MAVAAIGDTPMLPVIFESGTVEMPALERIAKSPARPRSTRAKGLTRRPTWLMPSALTPAAGTGNANTPATSTCSAIAPTTARNMFG